MFVTFSVNVGGNVVTSESPAIGEKGGGGGGGVGNLVAYNEEEEQSVHKVSSSSSPLTGVRIRLSSSNQCGARIVQIQSAK
jgi:hypothetical protein